MTESPTDDATLSPTSHDRSVYLVGVDGSPSSSRAVDFAARRAKATGGKVVLLHVVDWRPYSFPTVEDNENRPIRRAQELAAAEKGLAPMVDAVREAGADVDSQIKFGHPADAIVDVAHDVHATQVIVGRTGQSRLRTILFGSTPSHLVQTADMPVTVVP